MKKVIALILILVLCAAMMVGCQGKDPEKDSKLIYFVGLQSGGPAWVMAQTAFAAACDEVGWEGYYVAPTTANDSAQMITLMETAISAGADVIISCLFDPEAFEDVSKRARDAGILVISINTNAAGEDCIDFWYGTNQTTIGNYQAQAVIDGMKNPTDPITAVYMTMNIGSVTANQQFEAVKAKLAEYDNITLLDPYAPGNDAAKAADMLGSLIRADSSINAVICGSGQIAIGVGSYIKENGLEDKIISVGIDQSADTLNYVKSGALDCTITQGWYVMGHDTVIAARDYFNGVKIPYENDAGNNTLRAEDIDEFASKWGINLG